jgi:hypothetical protein
MGVIYTKKEIYCLRFPKESHNLTNLGVSTV